MALIQRIAWHGAMVSAANCGLLQIRCDPASTFVASPIPVAGTFQNWRCAALEAVGSGNTRTIKLQKNAADTALSVFFSGSSLESSDTDSVAFAAGDLARINQTRTGALVAQSTRSVLEWVPDDGVSQIYGFHDAGAIGAGFFSGVLGSNLAGNTEAVESSLFGTAGTITKLYINLNIAPGGVTSRTYFLVKNGTTQDGTGGTVDTRVTISGASTTGNATFSLSIAEGDLVSCGCSVSGSPAGSDMSGSIAFQSTTADTVMYAGSSDLTNASDSFYYPVWTRGDTSATETARELIAPLSGGLTLTGLRVAVTAAPTASNARIVTLKENGSATTLTVTVTGAATTGVTTGQSIELTGSDNWVIELDSTGTPAAATVKWCLISSTVTQVRGSAVFGEHTTVTATRAIAFGLDGNTNVHNTAGEFRVFGDVHITGDLNVDGAFGALAIDDLTDVALGSPVSDGHVLTYNGTNWTNEAPAGGGGALDDLSDVVISSPSSDEVLKYNGSNWVNAAVPGSSASISILAKAADETVNNSDVFQNDDHFSFSVAANEKWLVDLHFIITAANTTADFKVQWTVPAGATYYLAPLGVSCWEGVLTTQTPNALSTTFTAAGSMNGTFGVTIRSVLLIGGTAGTAQVQWAQNTTNATNLTVKAGSFMVRMKG